MKLPMGKPMPMGHPAGTEPGKDKPTANVVPIKAVPLKEIPKSEKAFVAISSRAIFAPPCALWRESESRQEKRHGDAGQPT